MVVLIILVTALVGMVAAILPLRGAAAEHLLRAAAGAAHPHLVVVAVDHPDITQMARLARKAIPAKEIRAERIQGMEARIQARGMINDARI
jgi:CHASE2 domain-containing sensor protein